MTTIVAICPYCRTGGVRAPHSAVGASATCPKCKSSFTVMPSDGLPGWAKDEQPAQPYSPPAEETKPVAAMGMADVTEPSPLLATEERAATRTQTAPVPRAEAEPESEHEPAEPADMGMVIALVALILVGVAVVAAQFPFGRLIALGIAVLGLIGGLASLGADGRARQAGWLAIGLHSLILLVVVLLPSWLNLDPWRGPPGDDRPTGPLAIEHATAMSQPIGPADWIDASRSSWGFQDIRVTVRSAHIGPVELSGPNGAKKTPKEQFFHLRMRVMNSGVEREFALTGWAEGEGLDSVRVADSTGKALKPATFEERWSPDRGKPLDRLFPGKSSEPRLIFTAPAGKPDWIRVQLPGAAVGVPDQEIKFRIDGTFLNRIAMP